MVQWTLDDSYAGPNTQSYQKLKWEIPALMRQTMIDISVRTGLSFQDGWTHPLTVKFVDQAPSQSENVLAYVQMLALEDGTTRSIAQELNLNLAAYEREQFDFPKVLAHELTHAMMIDLLGEEGSHNIPVWFHEGLAVYAADQGETMVKSYVYRLGGMAESRLINGLEGPHGALDYAEDYLAFKYIHEACNSNGLNNFIKEVIRRKGDIPGALDYSCQMSWDDFTKNAMIFSKQEIQKIGPPVRGERGKAY